MTTMAKGQRKANTEPQPSGCTAFRLRSTLPILTALLALCVPSLAFAVDPAVAKLVEQANAAYEAGEYEKALEAYAQAEVDCPTSPELAYNEALVHYRLRDFEKARELFNTALATRDLGLEERCKFNLGNVAYSQALEKLSSLQEAIDHSKQAISHYRDALELDPTDDDARANIETAQLLIKDLLDKLKKQQEEQKKKQDQEQNKDQQNKSDEQKKDEQKKDQQEKDEQQKESEKQKGENEKKQQKDQQQQDQQQSQDEQQQQGEQETQEQQEQQASEAKMGKMTKEEADRMLQAVRDKEAKRRDEKARRTRVRRARVSRDW